MLLDTPFIFNSILCVVQATVMFVPFSLLFTLQFYNCLPIPRSWLSHTRFFQLRHLLFIHSFLICLSLSTAALNCNTPTVISVCLILRNCVLPTWHFHSHCCFFQPLFYYICRSLHWITPSYKYPMLFHCHVLYHHSYLPWAPYPTDCTQLFQHPNCWPTGWLNSFQAETEWENYTAFHSPSHLFL